VFDPWTSAVAGILGEAKSYEVQIQLPLFDSLLWVESVSGIRAKLGHRSEPIVLCHDFFMAVGFVIDRCFFAWIFDTLA